MEFLIHFTKFTAMSKKKRVSSGTSRKPNKAKGAAKKVVKNTKAGKSAKKLAKKKSVSASKKVVTKKSKAPAKNKKLPKVANKQTKKLVKKVVVPKKSQVKKKSKEPIKKQATKASVKSSVKGKTTVKPQVSNKAVQTSSTSFSSTDKKAAEVSITKPTAKSASESSKTEVLAVMNTIPKEKVEELSASKIASITSSITNPIKTQSAYSVKPEKEPAGKFEMEFVIKASPELLYEFFSTASGLSEWFCDDVNIRNGIYTFIWDGQMQQARLLRTMDNQMARYQWVDKTDGSYFEFRIQRDDLTNDISLIVTDFAENKAEQESSKLLWNSQIEKLRQVIGSIF